MNGSRPRRGIPGRRRRRGPLPMPGAWARLATHACALGCRGPQGETPRAVLEKGCGIVRGLTRVRGIRSQALSRREQSVAARAAVENLVLRCSLGAQLAGGWLPVVEEHPGPVAWSSAMARITLTNEIYSAYLICMCAYYMIGDRINYVICASQSDSMPAACCPLYAAPLLTGDLHDS